MTAICLHFQVHQPYRLRKYSFFDIGGLHNYADEDANCDDMLSLARRSYLPMNALLLDLIRMFDGRFRVSFSLSGTALEQFDAYAPEVIQSFRELVATGHVELLSETSAHSLAFLYSPEEFREQVRQHDDRIEELFGVRPCVFRNAELIYNNELARTIEDMGYTGILAEGADHVLGWRSPDFVYQPVGCLKLRLLLRNYRLSEDIALRFSKQDWDGFPLTAEKFSSWVHAAGTGENIGETINLFMDYEVFGRHQKAETGIFAFMRALPGHLLGDPRFSFRTPSEVIANCAPVARLDVPQFVSWGELERDLAAWIGSDMQKDALESIYRLETKVRAINDPELLAIWRKLQTSDHFHHMSTKWFADSGIHARTNPYGTPYDAYINYMNVLGDFELTLDNALRKAA